MNKQKYSNNLSTKKGYRSKQKTTTIVQYKKGHKQVNRLQQICKDKRKKNKKKRQ